MTSVDIPFNDLNGIFASNKNSSQYCNQHTGKGVSSKLLSSRLNKCILLGKIVGRIFVEGAHIQHIFSSLYHRHSPSLIAPYVKFCEVSGTAKYSEHKACRTYTFHKRTCVNSLDSQPKSIYSY